MIAIIRIRGLVDVRRDIKEALYRLRLRKKFSCVVVNENKQIEGILKKIRNYVTYGKINEDTLKLLIEKRGKKVGNKLVKKEEINKIIEEIKNNKIKTIKPFFRLHPPRGGLKNIKQHYPKGDLGDRKEKINELIKRML
ncbi:MAG: 50S ribosomal protein L30 [Candidatus Pacearchaeota archaeon]